MVSSGFIKGVVVCKTVYGCVHLKVNWIISQLRVSILSLIMSMNGSVNSLHKFINNEQYNAKQQTQVTDFFGSFVISIK